MWGRSTLHVSKAFGILLCSGKAHFPPALISYASLSIHLSNSQMPRSKEGQDQSCVFISVGGQLELPCLPVISLASLPPSGYLGPNGKVCWGGCWAAVGREMLSVRARPSPAASRRHTLNSPGFFQQVCALIKPAPHSRCAGRGPPLKAAICQHEGEQKQAFQHHP